MLLICNNRFITEFAHHHAWLSNTLDVLDVAEGGSPCSDAIHALLESGRATCHDILQQNSASELGRKTLERINTALSAVPARTPSATNAAPVSKEQEQLWAAAARSLNVSPQAFSPSNEKEQNLGERIEHFEKQFLTYGADVMVPLIEKLPVQTAQEQGLKKALTYPFDTLKQNSINPLKNVEVARRIAQQLGVSWNGLLLGMPKHQADVNEAGFAPLARMMAFSESIDLSNEMEMFIVQHECFHMPQHALQRRNFDWYVKFYDSPRPRIIVNDEYQAYGLEIEAMNLRLDGALQKAAEKGISIDRDWMMRSLGTRPEQWMMTEVLCQLAAQYYPNGNAVSNAYPAAYCDAIKKTCLHDGYEIFEVINGQLTRVGT